MKVLIIFTLMLMFQLSAYAGNSLYVLDVGKQMEQVCVNSSETALSSAQNYLDSIITEKASLNGEIPPALMVFDAVSNEYIANIHSRENYHDLIQNRELSEKVTSLSELFKMVDEKNDTPPNNLIVYTSSPVYDLMAILTDIETVPEDIKVIEINLFSKKQDLPKSFFISQRVKINFYTCPETNSWKLYLQALEREIFSKVSKYTGYPADLIEGDISFDSDLGLGSFESYQLHAKVSADYKVVPPSGADMDTIHDLVMYIADQQLKEDYITSDGDPIRSRGNKKKEADEAYVQTVFYGTNRSESLDKNIIYDGERDLSDEPIKYGVCNVSIPKNHKNGVIEKPLLGLELFQDPKQHVYITSVEKLVFTEFFKKINAHLVDGESSDDMKQDIVVFIHGFNVKFNDAVVRTAQLAYDTGFEGVPMLFSWPSDGELFQYMSDREDATWSIKHVETFLTDVIKNTKAKRVHIVAHSMGHQALIGALNLMALKREKEDSPMFGNIIFAAPDYDSELFKHQISSNVFSLAENWTIYTSEKDAALNVSSTLNSTKRLGLPVTYVKGMTVIDASGIEVTPWSVPEFHSYYATKQTVIDDIISTLRGVKPEDRKLESVEKKSYKYWKIAR